MLLQQYIAGNGFTISTRVAPQCSPEIWVNSSNISRTTAFEFSPRINDIGDTAWATVFGDSPKDSLSKNDVWFNGTIVAKNVQVQDLALTDTHLVWISPKSNGTTITFFDLLSQDITIQSVDFASDKIGVSGSQFVVVGLDIVTGNAASAVLTPNHAPDVTWHGDRSMQLTGSHLNSMIIESRGDHAAMVLFNAMTMISEYSEEALAIATDDTGRVANMFVQRLQALTALAVSTGDADLQARAVKSALDAIGEADANGLYYQTRYSIGDTPAAWSMHTALIHGAALGALEWMSVAERDAVIPVAEAAFNYFEDDWVDGSYIITPHSGVDWDGVIQPNNMQAVMGSFALQLYNATGDQKYLDRANSLFEFLSQELIDYNGTQVWHYWAQVFRDGWSEGRFDSDSRPTYPANEPSLYDDVYHGALVINFFEEFARARGETPLVDATALFDLVQVNAYEFHGFLNGGPKGLDWLPPWPSAEQFQELARKPFPTTLAVYDEGVHIAAVAQAAAILAVGGVGTLNVTLRDPVSGEVIEVRTLSGAAAIVDWVQNLENVYAPSAMPTDVLFGNESAETLSGTSDADVIRGLDGDDVISLGDGADSGFGDSGDDWVDGGLGADTLAGGDGNDELLGGEGTDRLFGQAGDDILYGQSGDDVLSGGEGGDHLDGGGDADRLFGGGGMDQLFGGGGTDLLYGGEGSDLLNAGAGVAGEVQYLFGEGGNDTYVYGTESGWVYIGSRGESAATGTADQVVFTDLNAWDVILGHQDYRESDPAEGLALMIMWESDQGSGQLQIANGGRYIESFQFADGAVFDTLQLAPGAGGTYVSTASGASADMIFGGAGTDRLYGGGGADLLNAGGRVADDFQYLFGEGGNDTYVYRTDSGRVYIGSRGESAATGTADRVVFTDLNAWDVILGHQDYRASYPAEGLAMMIMWENDQGSGQLQVANGGRHIESFQFVDGAVFDTLQLAPGAGGTYVSTASGASADMIFGGAGTDRLYGGGGADLLNAGASVASEFQYLYGEGGNDTYVYGTESGRVYIGSRGEGATTGTADRVVFTDLNAWDVILGYQDYRGSYPNEGLALMIMWENDQGSGQLQIANGGQHIESFQFADGTVLNLEQLMLQTNGATIAGTSGADTLNGTGRDDLIQGLGGDDILSGGNGNDQLEGGAGTDRLFGGAGNDRLDAGQGVAGQFQYLNGEGGDDTYVYGTASGMVYIGSRGENAGSGAADRVVFTDLRVADVTIRYQDYRDSYPAEGLAMMIMWKNEQGSGQLQIANGGRHIETFQFADGAVFTAQQLAALTQSGNPAAAGPQILPAAAGDKTAAGPEVLPVAPGDKAVHDGPLVLPGVDDGFIFTGKFGDAPPVMPALGDFDAGLSTLSELELARDLLMSMAGENPLTLRASGDSLTVFEDWSGIASAFRDSVWE